MRFSILLFFVLLAFATPLLAVAGSNPAPLGLELSVATPAEATAIGGRRGELGPAADPMYPKYLFDVERLGIDGLLWAQAHFDADGKLAEVTLSFSSRWYPMLESILREKYRVTGEFNSNVYSYLYAKQNGNAIRLCRWSDPSRDDQVLLTYATAQADLGVRLVFDTRKETIENAWRAYLKRAASRL
jgi:hypothetical protein